MTTKQMLLDDLNVAQNLMQKSMAQLGHAANDVAALIEMVMRWPDSPTQFSAPLSQRDTRWSAIPLGAGPKTIGEVGCLTTCVAFILNMTPLALNDWLKAHNGFANGNLFVWASVEALGLKLASLVECPLPSQTPLQRIQDTLKSGGFVIAQVDFDAKTKRLDEHWVVVLSLDATNARVMDPWPQPPDSNLMDLCPKYGKAPALALWKVAFYERIKFGA